MLRHHIQGPYVRQERNIKSDDDDRHRDNMKEIEKMRAGMPFSVRDPEVYASKLHAVEGCKKLNSIDGMDTEGKEAAIRELFGSVGKEPMVLPVFSCDTGKNIHVGDYFLANYNVVILDIAEFRAGDYVWIGPNTLITTIGHPLSPKGRREYLGIAKPVVIGNDVWIGGNVTILPGVTIGNNVVIGAGAVVTHDVPDNSVAAGVPAKVIKKIENDLEPRINYPFPPVHPGLLERQTDDPDLEKKSGCGPGIIDADERESH